MKNLTYDGIIAAAGNVSVPATVSVVQDFDRPNGREYTVTVEFDRHEFTGMGADAFWAFERAREQYEPLGWRVAVQGASVHCFPSGMQGEAGALVVYRHPESLEDAQPEPVVTFAAAALDEIVTFAEQMAAQRERMEPLRRSGQTDRRRP
ncbi:hypothetical protein [Microbacterium sp. SA39]|uniref:hypothetical protein n=1 Tax=Microbacterium sp. SA39 TaxID=1263625 RepID=UPI00061E1943|nr:hypothetical protein [Microbacterium sp. SA39]KJQ53317.1 hypothetical protein RS85_02831 [Microbacterium sp. SA39]